MLSACSGLWSLFIFLKICVYYTHISFGDEQCLLKKLYLRSEHEPAKEMHAVIHKKENIKDTKEREKYEMLEYATYYSLQARKG